MNVNKKTYNVSIKLTRKFNSISITEGFEVEVDKDFNEFEFETHKQMIKDKLIEEGKKYLDNVIDTVEVTL